MDESKGFLASLRRLLSQWPLLLALALLVAFGTLFIEKKLNPPAPPPVAPAPVTAETAPADKAAPESNVESPADSVSGQTVDVPVRPVILSKGQAKWDDAQKTLTEATEKINGAAQLVGLATNGRPLTVFTSTDDAGFHFEVMVPLARAPEGKPKLPDGFEIGSSPAGKALKFQHRGAYDEIDATYEAITAYLDEKGIDTQNAFVEEYLTALKNGDDEKTEVDIYVFVK
jgi:effector-binding domain-containing protein